MPDQPATLVTVEDIPPAPAWSGVTEGRIVHVRVPGVSHCQPAIVVRTWGGHAVNLQVFRDGTNDGEGAQYLYGAERTVATRWATSVPYVTETDEGNQSWHWPERA